MKKVLFVNAYVNRNVLRTGRLARDLIMNLGGSEVEDLGIKTVKPVAETCGFKKIGVANLEGLDIVAMDSEAIMTDALSSIPSKIL